MSVNRTKIASECGLKIHEISVNTKFRLEIFLAWIQTFMTSMKNNKFCDPPLSHHLQK